jgi:hypothetical protein
MTTSLNKHSQEFAQDQIKQGHVVLDQRDDWSEHQPSTKAENEFIGPRGKSTSTSRTPPSASGRCWTSRTADRRTPPSRRPGFPGPLVPNGPG